MQAYTTQQPIITLVSVIIGSGVAWAGKHFSAGIVANFCQKSKFWGVGWNSKCPLLHLHKIY